MSFAALLEHRDGSGAHAAGFQALLAKDEQEEIVVVSLPTEASGDGSFKKPVKNAFEFSASPEEANSASSKIGNYALTAGEFLSSKLGWIGLVRSSISRIGLDSFDYKRYYTAANLPLRQKGYVLLMTNVLAGDLNAFGRRYAASTMTGAEISSMAKDFDRLFCPLPMGIFAPLVAIEWPLNPKGVYDRRSGQSYTNGGMRGGYNNAYWGVTQFGNSKKAPTYTETVAAARRYGVDLPQTRQEMTFGQMLVAAYVLAIVRQPTLVQLGLPVNAETVYINHNQGNGIWKLENKLIPYKNWKAQSSTVHRILRKYGYRSA